VNLASLSVRATWRTRSSSLDTLCPALRPERVVERRLNPARETVLVPFVAGMTLAVVAGFARS